MSGILCRRCGSGGLEKSYMSVRCPVCGDRRYLPEADAHTLWAEHRLGLMYRKGGWMWLDEFDPPAWFIENVA